MLKTSIEAKILDSIRDERPITAIQVIENYEKCPKGFVVIRKTFDQDQEADLGEFSLFKISSRYLCLSRTEGNPNCVISDLKIITDKSNFPQGFSIIDRTSDSGQKPFKKKQICYSICNQRETPIAITDIILCSRLTKAPAGFKFAGEVRGVTICFKMGNTQDTQGKPVVPGRPAPSLPNANPMYPSLGSDHDYEILKPGPLGPSRPAPMRPPAPLPLQNNSVHTLGNFQNALDDVPFVVNPRFLKSVEKKSYPVIKAKTMEQLIKEYDYPFTVERQS